MVQNGVVATAEQKLGTTEQQHLNGGLLRIGLATAAQKRRIGVLQHQLQKVDRAILD
jgi:hypothetical protein